MVLDFKKQFEQKAASVKQSRMEKEKAMMDLQRDIDQAEAAAASANSAEEYAQHKSRAGFAAKQLAERQATQSEAGYSEQEIAALYRDVKEEWASEAIPLYEEAIEALDAVRPVVDKLQALTSNTYQTLAALNGAAERKDMTRFAIGGFVYGVLSPLREVVDGTLAQQIALQIEGCRRFIK